MQLLLIFLTIGFTRPDKLDRTYLPPPGASLAGGSPEDILTPLETPNLPLPDNILFGTVGLSKARPNEQLAVVPVTTTSYAFTQTTTYPPLVNYETTAIPIDLINQLPGQRLRKPGFQNDIEINSDFTQNQGQNIPISGIFAPQTPLDQGEYINTGSPKYDQFGNKPRNQYTDQYTNNPVKEYISDFKDFLNQQEFLPSLQENKPISLPQEQYNQIGPLEQITETISSSPPINGEDQLNQLTSGHQNSANNLNHIIAEAFSGLTTTNQPNRLFSSVSSTTPATRFSSPTLAYSSIGSINQPERPQAEGDLNAVIVKYENVHTPTGYSYNYDTSNGIHVDENASVGDGTKAQGSYSYIGDDGKIYSIVYTADENGFHPRGDHLPTAPPIPEAIQKVIEQAARDKEAGIIDDGSYDEEKYGYKDVKRPVIYPQPQTKKVSYLDNSLHDGTQRKQVKPVSGITEDEYYNDELLKRSQDENNNNKSKARLSIIQPSDQPSNKITVDEYSKNISGEDKETFYDDETNLPLTGSEGLKAMLPTSEINYSLFKNDRTKYLESQRDNKVTPKIAGSYKQEPFLSESDISNPQKLPQAEFQQLDKDGYQYNAPEIQFSQSQFPARFKEQDLSSSTKSSQKTETGTTLRPFMTPEVYNQPSYGNKEEYRQITTPRPFLTPEAARQTDYDDNNVYVTEQKISNDNASNEGLDENLRSFTPVIPKEKSASSYQSSTYNPNHSPITPSSRFSNKLMNQGTKTSDGPTYSEDIGGSVYTEMYPDSLKTSYQYQPAYGSRIPSRQKVYMPQNYHSSTYKPIAPGFQSDSGSLIPSGSFIKSPSGTYNTGNQYEPDHYSTSTYKQPTPGYSPISTPNYSQTTIGQKPNFSSSTTVKLPTRDKPGLFALFGPDGNAPKSSPIDNYQTRYQYGTRNPSYTTTISPSYPGATKDYPELGYIYGPPTSTTSSVSIIATTPGYETSTTTGSPFQPFLSSQYNQSLVDNFGRPILSEQNLNAGQKPNQATQFVNGQESRRPGDQLTNNVFPVRDQYPTYKKYDNQPTVIGEDFSGPKQPQRFDSETGYYYK